ncbi:MAG TPA: molybdopterin cofactor-binding domain-containing protein, partial [Lacipirellula sp.]
MEIERYELRSPPAYRFSADRREFVGVLGAGLVIAVGARSALAQRGDRRGRRWDYESPEKLSERFHISEDGVVTVMTGKVEIGQGSRTQITQAAAEELGLPVDAIRVIMADTELCPDDGGTAGSRTTPSTVPRVRRSAALARELLVGMAAEKLGVERSALTFSDGKFEVEDGSKGLTLAELVRDADVTAAFSAAKGDEATVRRVDQWQVFGTSVPKVASEAVVTGAAKYPSDVALPGMVYGKVLRAPALGATLESVDLSAAEQLEGVKAVRDGEFVGCTAPTSWQAAKAIEALAKTARWKTTPQPSSDELFEHLKKTATGEPRSNEWGDGAAALEKAANKLQATYTVAYIQHAPMEPRACVAQWDGGKLTVWCGTQQPSRVHGELQNVFQLPGDKVRVIVPDTGGGFGGKHTGEAVIEAARLAKAAGRPVSLRWTREEEFVWAYSRPAGVIEVQAALDDEGRLRAWDFANYNSGESGIATPYEIPHGRTQFFGTHSPLRQGSYRALASTANNFARESAIDELAAIAEVDPLEFRLKHLPDGRLKDVLVAAAEKFGWRERRSSRKENRGVGLACGTEKGSYVAACVEVELVDGQPKVLSVCQAFECGAIQNPLNLRQQVEGCIVMGLGGALTEAMRFKDGKVHSTSFATYHVPRMSDLPELDVVLVDRPDLNSVGAGETPIIAVAPAIANAMVHAGAERVRSM